MVEKGPGDADRERAPKLTEKLYLSRNDRIAFQSYELWRKVMARQKKA